jgi:hypothetical protein
LPEPGIAAIVLANEDIAMGPVRRLSETALSALLRAKIGQQPKPPVEPVEMTVEQLSAFAGQYESESYWAELRAGEGHLLAEVSGQRMSLTPVGPLAFEADGQFVHRGEVTFREDDNGRIVGFSALGQSFTAAVSEQGSWIPDAWQKYLGSYGPDFIPLVISARHGHLYAMTENMMDYRLTPINQHVFRMPRGLYTDEYLVFQFAPAGEVHTAVLANMPLKVQR